MAARSRGLGAPPCGLKIRWISASPLPRPLHGLAFRREWLGGGARCCCGDAEFRKLGKGTNAAAEKAEVRWLEPRKSCRRVCVKALPAVPFPSPREKEWGINLLDEKVDESGTNEDGSTWYQESGADLGDNGYRHRWARMGGQSCDGSSEWKETWWEKSDWTGYKELGAEKSGKNAEGDSWWETWQEVLYQDEWSNLARIERSAQKQAKSGTENAGWYENWWEKYDAKGSTEKKAYKYGRLDEQSWWEKWGEYYDGRGFVAKWTDKWAETELGTKWGDKWEERFFAGIGSRQGETWHVSPTGERKYINMVTAQQEKAGILLSMKKPIMRLSLIMDGRMLLATRHSCYLYNLKKSHQVGTVVLILVHCRPEQTIHQIHPPPLKSEEFVVGSPIFLLDSNFVLKDLSCRKNTPKLILLFIGSFIR
uniref:Uncharacterized protein LOC105042638 isoform X3 n=1 Tax=Elaeis guineensis var. tenera TaxID=51953 RepID=A0A8N4IF98_ELAGV|nr:uncharacterized protein LOC105042638 isoform X3 [Elaeis guineensis]